MKVLISRCLVKSTLIGLISLIGTLNSSAQAQSLLNGIATHTELGKEQFVAGLYTSILTDDSKSILLSNDEKRIEVRVTADRFSSRRFKRMWIEGMAINASSVELANQSNNMAKFSNMLKVKLIPGDIFAINRDTESVKVEINGTELGSIDDPLFFDLLLRTWIGPVPLSSEFRDNLLSAGEIDGALLARFQATEPKQSRIAAIEEGVLALRNSSTNNTPKDKPVINVPKVAIAAPKTPTTKQDSGTEPKIQAPTLDIAKPEIAAPGDIALAPKIEAPKNQETTASVAVTPEPKVEDKVVETVAKVEEKITESIFEEDDQEEFTAANLLEQQLYIASLKRWSQKHLRYPRTSLNKGHEGNVRLEITVNRKGKVTNLETLEESKYKLLNKEARAAVKRATPFPKMPELIDGDSFTFTLPIAFKLVSKK